MTFGLIMGVSLCIILLWAYREGTLPETLFLIFLLVGIVSCHQSDWYQASQREQAAADAAAAKRDAMPRIIRETDGCKVYTFKDAGKWHYFTKCPTTTTTEAHHDETTGSGKQQKTVDVSETVVTENVK